jgi:hypothetical protein
MTLLRRKSEPTPAEKALAIFGKVVQALAAVRAARTAYGTYKVVRRLPLLLGLTAAGGAVVALVRRRKGAGDGAQVATWSPPAPAGSSPSPAPELTPNPAQTAGTGSPPVEPELEPATPPSVSAAGDEDVADAPGESSEASSDKA